MKAIGPVVLFVAVAVIVGIAGIAHVREVLALVIIIASIVVFGKSIFHFSSGGKAVARVLLVLLLTAVGFGEIYYLLPLESFYPPIERGWSGVADALYFSIVTMVTFSCDTHSSTGWFARLVQLSQTLIGVVMIGYGVNHVLEQQKENGTPNKGADRTGDPQSGSPPSQP